MDHYEPDRGIMAFGLECPARPTREDEKGGLTVARCCPAYCTVSCSPDVGTCMPRHYIADLQAHHRHPQTKAYWDAARRLGTLSCRRMGSNVR